MACASVESIKETLEQLSDLPQLAVYTIFAAEEIQCLLLNLYGIHEWMTVMVPRIENPNFVATVPGDYLGCFTTSASDMVVLYQIGIPILSSAA